MSACIFCGHPDQRHRLVDAISGRLSAGETPESVWADYEGITTEEQFERTETEVLTIEAKAFDMYHASLKIVDAIQNEGKYPEYHRKAMLRLEKEWPTLWDAIQQLIKENVA